VVVTMIMRMLARMLVRMWRSLSIHRCSTSRQMPYKRPAGCSHGLEPHALSLSSVTRCSKLNSTCLSYRWPSLSFPL
tara:strand:- start:194 stop:424 length:231 start_codon:yes stop_codon:yes gene_type:complete